MSNPKLDPSSLSAEDRAVYDEVLAAFQELKLKRFKIRIFQEAKLVHTDILNACSQEEDAKTSAQRALELLKSGRWCSAMLESEHIIYIDPNAKDMTPEIVLEYQLLLGASGLGAVKDFRIISVEDLGEVLAAAVLSPEKFQESVEAAYEHKKTMSQPDTSVPPERMN